MSIGHVFSQQVGTARAIAIRKNFGTAPESPLLSIFVCVTKNPQNAVTYGFGAYHTVLNDNVSWSLPPFLSIPTHHHCKVRRAYCRVYCSLAILPMLGYSPGLHRYYQQVGCPGTRVLYVRIEQGMALHRLFFLPCTQNSTACPLHSSLLSIKHTLASLPQLQTAAGFSHLQ